MKENELIKSALILKTKNPLVKYRTVTYINLLANRTNVAGNLPRLRPKLREICENNEEVRKFAHTF